MIIGFHGRLGSGKDTAALRLAKIVDVPIRMTSFADKLKDSAAALLDIDREWLETNKNNPDARIVVIDGFVPSGFVVDGEEIEEPNIAREFTIREYLQRYGTEAHRDIFSSDFWVDQALGVNPVSSARRILRLMELVLVTDVRFDNEVDGIHERDGVVVDIQGKFDTEIWWDEINGTYRTMESDMPVHPSEWPLQGCDFTIDNTNHNDQFAKLDDQLYELAEKLELPIKEV